MGRQRKRHSNEFKAKVALEAVKGLQTLSELASRYSVHPTQIAQWKKRLTEGAPSLYEGRSRTSATSEDELTGPLYEEIGRLKVENDFLKKKF